MNMDTNILIAVQGLLRSGDKCVTCIDAGLVQDWVKSNRLLAVVEHSGEHGLFILTSSKSSPSSSNDLLIEKVLPVNDSFKCEIDASGTDPLEENVYLKITCNKQKLLFELPYNPKAKAFVALISKASEALSLRMGPPSDFKWLSKYQTFFFYDSTFLFDGTENDNSSLSNADTRSVNSALSFEDNFSDVYDSTAALCIGSCDGDIPRGNINSPDFGNLPRESIAMGVTPLAARESVIRLQMAMREDDYTDLQTYSVFTGTWNVNGQSPRESLGEWLSIDEEPPDFYAVGFQELDLSKEAYLFTDTPKEEEWLEAVKNGLHPKAEYRMVRLTRLIGMMLIVFVKEEHTEHIKNVAADTVGTGIMGKLGNKGGVAIRLDFHRTSICFVNCHLAAHVEECERRNQDYNDICARIAFNQFKPPKFIKNHDHIYWTGDMNYRIMDLDTDQVKVLIERKCFPVLLEHDQLTIQQSLKKVFVGFIEGAINFVPTYKYDTGTNNWDSSEKNRPPAWCDRILWKGDSIEQIYYRSHPTLLYSDHKPVSALFESKVKVINSSEYRRIYEEVMKKLDKLENEFLPQVTLDKLEVHFDKVYFIEPKLQTITIANTGQVPVQFEFKKKLNDSKYCKDWLTVKPCASFLKPGEKCDVDLEVLVDKRIAYKLNAGQDKIYDILVLHLEGGKDLFITVAGYYEPSSFGSSLEALVRISEPVLEVPASKLIDLENCVVNKSIFNQPPLFEIPKEIWVLVDHLYKFGLTQEDLFQLPGLRGEVQKIREKLDAGISDLSPCSIHSAAEAFLLFLEALAEPVIPYEFYHKCLDCASNYVGCKNVIVEIPKTHKNVFRYLIAFLRELVSHSSYNKLDAKLLATIFGGIILRGPPGLGLQNSSVYRKTGQQALERKKATFIFHFLMNDMDD